MKYTLNNVRDDELQENNGKLIFYSASINMIIIKYNIQRQLLFSYSYEMKHKLRNKPINYPYNKFHYVCDSEITETARRSQPQ